MNWRTFDILFPRLAYVMEPWVTALRQTVKDSGFRKGCTDMDRRGRVRSAGFAFLENQFSPVFSPSAEAPTSHIPQLRGFIPPQAPGPSPLVTQGPLPDRIDLSHLQESQER